MAGFGKRCLNKVTILQMKHKTPANTGLAAMKPCSYIPHQSFLSLPLFLIQPCQSVRHPGLPGFSLVDFSFGSYLTDASSRRPFKAPFPSQHKLPLPSRARSSMGDESSSSFHPYRLNSLAHSGFSWRRVVSTKEYRSWVWWALLAVSTAT